MHTKSAIDKLQEGVLSRGKNAALQTRGVEDGHEAGRRKMMRVHDLEGARGDAEFRKRQIHDGERLRIEGERSRRPITTIVSSDGKALR